MLAFIYIFPLLLQRLKKNRSLLLFAVSSFYIYFQRSSTDYNAYYSYFVDAASGRRVSGIEPVYPLLSRMWGIILPVNEITFPLFITSISIALLFLIMKEIQSFNSIFYSNRVLYSLLLIISFYAIVYQVAFNFRGGIATLFFIIAYLKYKKQKKSFYIYALISMLTHIQVFPIVCFLIFLNLLKDKRFIISFSVILLLLIIVFYNIMHNFFYDFVFLQGKRYLSNYSGNVRIAVIPYLIIDVLILLRGFKLRKSNNRSTEFNVNDIVVFHLFIQLLFFSNSHISSRLVRPIEPLILCGFYYSLISKGRKKMELFLGSFLVFLPGFSFIFMQII